MQYVKIGPHHYVRTKTLYYFSTRYRKWITVYKGEVSDGATGAFDIASDAWWVHDKICARGTWDDGTPITPLQGATVLGDILYSEGRIFRSMYWKVFTYLFGCHKLRENGRWLWRKP